MSRIPNTERKNEKEKIFRKGFRGKRKMSEGTEKKEKGDVEKSEDDYGEIKRE